MFEISSAFLLSAFVAGIFMFLAPCTLPLVPAFLASLVGKERVGTYRRTLVFKTLQFCVGFTIVFVGLGVLTGFVGSSLTQYKTLLSQIGGVLIIVLALVQLRAIPALYIQRATNALRAFFPQVLTSRMPFILGIIFALGWSPCSGPILASILVLASESGTALQGGVLLTVFSLGLAIPFILTGALFAHTVHVFHVYERYDTVITMISGVLLLMLGILLLFQNAILMTHAGFALYSFFGYTPLCSL